MGKKSGSGIRILNVPPGSYFRELKKQCFGFKYLTSLMWIRDGKNSYTGWKKIGSGIRDGNIPDPQHWILIRQDQERLEKKRRGEVLEGEEEAVITALDMEDAWKKEVGVNSSCADVCVVHVYVIYVTCSRVLCCPPPPPRDMVNMAAQTILLTLPTPMGTCLL
jgi:hypothetical protein